MTDPTPQELRDWSKAPVPRTPGKLPAGLIRAWNKAHPDRPYPVRWPLGTWHEKHHP